MPTDPVDQAGQETFPASDAPPFSGAHAGPPPPQAVLRVLVDLPPDSPDATHFRAALARFDARITVTYAHGDAFARALPDAEVVVAGGLTDAELARAPRLRWLSSVAAGLDGIATPALLGRGVAVTSASGVHGPNIAEHLLAMILMFTRGFPKLFRAQIARRWERGSRGGRSGFARPSSSREVRNPSAGSEQQTNPRSDGPGELTGKTLLVVGLGRIGEALAARARPFGVRVVAVKHQPARRYDPAVGVDEVLGPGALDEALSRADHVCLTVPLTEATHHLMDARRLACMRPDAFLYNVSRGAVIDEPALVAALRAGQLAGAGLDVFEEEPLPAESPLWELPNVILTPHVAGVTPRYYERAAALFADNLERFLAGQPLENRFDSGRGY